MAKKRPYRPDVNILLIIILTLVVIGFYFIQTPSDSPVQAVADFYRQYHEKQTFLAKDEPVIKDFLTNNAAIDQQLVARIYADRDEYIRLCNEGRECGGGADMIICGQEPQPENIPISVISNTGAEASLNVSYFKVTTAKRDNNWVITDIICN